MDLNLLGRALWRFKWLVLFGLVLAAGLTFFATIKVTKTGQVSYRQREQWASHAQVLVTQHGFPWGQLAPSASAQGDRFVALALVYASLVNSDPVKRRMAEMGPRIAGRVEAAAVTTSPGSSDALPIISIAGIAGSKRDSLTLTGRATTSLVSYIRNEQTANHVSDRNRVVVQVIQEPGQLELLAGRSKTIPIMVFLAALTVVVALILVLENLRPRIRQVERDVADEPLAPQKLSA